MPQVATPAKKWIYQNTAVDVPSFSRTLDQAMALAGIPRSAQAPAALGGGGRLAGTAVE